jgi:two-component system response regulator PhcR
VLVTDYRMPERDGMKLLRAVQRDFRHVIRLLATAYAEKDVAIAAVNQGKVLRILEKPLDGEATREALREALACYRAQALERVVNEGRVAALREALGFLAHELNTPLATVRGYVELGGRRASARRRRAPGVAQFREDHPGRADGRAGARRAARAVLPVAGVHLRAVGARRLSRRRAAVDHGQQPGGGAAGRVPVRGGRARWRRRGRAHDFRLPGGATCCTSCCAR